MASNIAEGWGRQTNGEFKQFLGIARGSNLEVQTQLFIAVELGYGEETKGPTAFALSEEVAKMLVSFMQSL